MRTKLVCCRKHGNPRETIARREYWYSLRFVDCSEFEDSVYGAELDLDDDGAGFQNRFDKLVCAAERVMYPPLADDREWVAYGFIKLPNDYSPKSHYYDYGGACEVEIECDPDPLRIVGGDNGNPEIVFNGDPVVFEHADASEILTFIMGPELDLDIPQSISRMGSPKRNEMRVNQTCLNAIFQPIPRRRSASRISQK